MCNYIGFIGCWSSSEQSGIHVVRANTQTGEICLLHAIDQASPSFLAVSSNEKYLYSGALSTKTHASQKGEVVAYRILDDFSLKEINRCASCSADGACHIATSNDGHWVYASNYDEGRAIVYHCENNGALFGPVQIIQFESAGPHPQQDVAHIHFACDTPDGQFVCIIDLSSDAVMIYRRLSNGLLEKFSVCHTPIGSGARHLTFSPDGKMAYVVSEMSACISVYQYNDGRLKYLDTVSLLSPEHSGKMSGSAIHITPDGSLLFAGNRFANQIVSFRIAQNGYIAPVSYTACALPRDLRISPNGECLYVCGSEDDLLEVFKINYETGRLTRLWEYKAPSPASICFLNHKLV